MYNPNPSSKQGRCRRRRKKRSDGYSYPVYSSKFVLGCYFPLHLPYTDRSQASTDYSTGRRVPFEVVDRLILENLTPLAQS